MVQAKEATSGAIAFQPTVSYETLVESISREPKEIFDEYPITDIRRRCIKAFADKEMLLESEWIEPRILSLFREPGIDLGEKLLECYLNRASNRGNAQDVLNYGARAIEFALGELLIKHPHVEWLAQKHVCKALSRQSSLYWQGGSLKKLFDSQLDRLLRQTSSAEGYEEYHEDNMDKAIQTLRHIIQVQDTTWIETIAPITAKLENGSLRISKHNWDPLLPAQQLASFQQGLKMLRQAEKSQKPDLAVTVGSYFRQKAGINSSVVVRVDYPMEHLLDGEQTISIAVRFECSDSSENDMLATALSGTSVRFLGDGFPRHYQGFIWGHSTMQQVPLDGLSCCFNVKPLRTWQARFWLTFLEEDDETKLVSAAYYIKKIKLPDVEAVPAQS